MQLVLSLECLEATARNRCTSIRVALGKRPIVVVMELRSRKFGHLDAFLVRLSALHPAGHLLQLESRLSERFIFLKLWGVVELGDTALHRFAKDARVTRAQARTCIFIVALVMQSGPMSRVMLDDSRRTLDACGRGVLVYIATVNVEHPLVHQPHRYFSHSLNTLQLPSYRVLHLRHVPSLYLLFVASFLHPFEELAEITTRFSNHLQVSLVCCVHERCLPTCRCLPRDIRVIVVEQPLHSGDGFLSVRDLVGKDSHIRNSRAWSIGGGKVLVDGGPGLLGWRELITHLRVQGRLRSHILLQIKS